MLRLQMPIQADLNSHSICPCSKRPYDLVSKIVASNIERLSMLPFQECLYLAACKGRNICGDIFSLNPKHRQLLVLKSFGNVHFLSTGDEDLDTTCARNSHYTSDEAENILSRLLWTFIQGVKYHKYLGQVFDERNKIFTSTDQRWRQGIMLELEQVLGYTVFFSTQLLDESSYNMGDIS
jgi:hypothetical protein